MDSHQSSAIHDDHYSMNEGPISSGIKVISAVAHFVQATGNTGFRPQSAKYGSFGKKHSDRQPMTGNATMSEKPPAYSVKGAQMLLNNFA